MNFKDVEKIIDKHIDKVIAFRRDLHENPELGTEEVRTSGKVIEALKKLPISVREKVGGLGVVGLLEGSAKGKTILLRADMDALPINEVNDLPFKSKVPNVMHACGHDMHTAMLLGAAMVLSEMKDQIKGNVKFMFQPNEESAPVGGAKAMMADGVLENPKVDEAFGLHVYGCPTGSISFTPGVANSRSDRIYIEIKGKSSHGSLPNEGKDAIVAASAVVGAIQTIVSRNLGPFEKAVITLGKMNGGNRYNVLCDTILMEGTVRTFNNEVTERIKLRLQETVENVAKAYGCVGVLDYQDGYDFIWNDLELSKIVIESLTPILGKENIEVLDNPLPAGEDFSFISKKVPSVFMWLGAESQAIKGKCILHNPNFMVDEDSLRVGIKIMCKIVLDRING